MPTTCHGNTFFLIVFITTPLLYKRHQSKALPIFVVVFVCVDVVYKKPIMMKKKTNKVSDGQMEMARLTMSMKAVQRTGTEVLLLFSGTWTHRSQLSPIKILMIRQKTKMPCNGVWKNYRHWYCLDGFTVKQHHSIFFGETWCVCLAFHFSFCKTHMGLPSPPPPCPRWLVWEKAHKNGPKMKQLGTFMHWVVASNSVLVICLFFISSFFARNN